MAACCARSGIGSAAGPGAGCGGAGTTGRRPVPGPARPGHQKSGSSPPPVRAVLRDGDLRIVHVNGVLPGVPAIPARAATAARPLGADHGADLRVVGGAAQLPGEIDLASARTPPGRSRAAAGRAASAGAVGPARSPRVIGAVAEVSGQHDLGLGPAGHVRPADPQALMVMRHARFLRRNPESSCPGRS